MRGRHSSKAMDKVCAIALPLQSRGSNTYGEVIFPIYDSNMPVSEAWDRLISSITSTKMHHHDLFHVRENRNLSNSRSMDRKLGHNHLMRVYQTPTIQLLRMFPHPSRHHWFPSWAQVQQYPDVSVRDNDLGGISCALCAIAGRTYPGCSVQPIEPPHPSSHHWLPSWAQVLQYPEVSVTGNNPVLVAEHMGYSLRIRSGRIPWLLSPAYSPTHYWGEGNLLLYDGWQSCAASGYSTWDWTAYWPKKEV